MFASGWETGEGAATGWEQQVAKFSKFSQCGGGGGGGVSGTSGEWGLARAGWLAKVTSQPLTGWKVGHVHHGHCTAVYSGVQQCAHHIHQSVQ